MSGRVNRAAERQRPMMAISPPNERLQRSRGPLRIKERKEGEEKRDRKKERERVCVRACPLSLTRARVCC